MGLIRRCLMIWPIFLALGLSLALEGDAAKAHNNPGFKEVLLITVDVSDQPLAPGPLPVHSEAFDLDLPKKTIELIWRVEGLAGEAVVFAVAQADTLHAEGLTDGANSRILRGGDIHIVNVEGARAPFRLKVIANVIDRSKKDGDA